PGQLLTGDHNLVNVQVVVNYAVDPDAVVDYVVQRERAEEVIARTVETVLAEWVAGRTVDDVLLGGKRSRPQDLVTRARQRLGGYRLGVLLRGADGAHLAPPEDVKPYFDQVAQAEAERRTKVVQAQQDAERKESESAAEVQRWEEETRAYTTNRPR